MVFVIFLPKTEADLFFQCRHPVIFQNDELLVGGRIDEKRMMESVSSFLYFPDEPEYRIPYSKKVWQRLHGQEVHTVKEVYAAQEAYTAKQAHTAQEAYTARRVTCQIIILRYIKFSVS